MLIFPLLPVHMDFGGREGEERGLLLYFFGPSFLGNGKRGVYLPFSGTWEFGGLKKAYGPDAG